MKLGIDASNITSGGGLTHLIELLDCVNPSKFGFSQVVVWSSSKVLSKINKYEWLELVSDSLLDGGLLRRVYWQKNILKKGGGHKMAGGFTIEENKIEEFKNFINNKFSKVKKNLKKKQYSIF